MLVFYGYVFLVFSSLSYKRIYFENLSKKATPPFPQVQRLATDTVCALACEQEEAGQPAQGRATSQLPPMWVKSPHSSVKAPTTSLTLSIKPGLSRASRACVTGASLVT